MTPALATFATADLKTDFGILTFLLTDSQKGSLQVLSKTGEWIPADPIPVSDRYLTFQFEKRCHEPNSTRDASL